MRLSQDNGFVEVVGFCVIRRALLGLVLCSKNELWGRLGSDIMVVAVFFDLGDTLVRLKASIWLVAAEKILCHRAGLPAHKREIASFAAKLDSANRAGLVKMAEWDLSSVQTDSMEQLFWKEYYSQMLTDLHLSFPTRDAVDYLSFATVSPDAFEVFADVEPVLLHLKARGTVIGLISNVFPSATRIIARHNLSRYLEPVVLSYVTGCRKPDPEIYELALHKANVVPDRALFVDDRTAFLRGASSVGMKAALIDRSGAVAYNDWSGNRLSSLHEVFRYVRTGNSPTKSIYRQFGSRHENLVRGLATK